MPFTQPTRQEILARIKADMRVELGVDPLSHSVESAFAIALMGQSKGQYGFLSYIFRQCFADTADAFYFWRWAAIFGITQKPASAWQGVVEFTGTNTTVVPAGTEISRSDGQLYTTDSIGTISGGVADIPCTASTGGILGNNDADQVLVLTSPISGIDSSTTVLSTTHTGADVENQEDGLVRLLLRLQTPPSGGGPGDYVRWALEVDGVTRAWEFPLLEGPNSVSVAFVRDNDGTGAAIVPDAGERAAVLAHLQAVAPVTVDVRVIELVALVVNVQISSLVPDTSPVHTAIENSLADFFSRDGEPGVTLALSRLDVAISEADGEVSHVLDSPVAPIVPTTAQIPVFGTLTVV